LFVYEDSGVQKGTFFCKNAYARKKTAYHLPFFPGIFIAFILSSMVRKNILANITTFTLSRKLIQRSEQGTKSLHELIQRPKQWLHFIPLASAVIYLSLSD
jgi:hypothetical protein